MDISSVKSSPVQPAQAPKRTQESEKNQNSEVNSKALEVASVQAQKPAPVVNSQGQTTGRLLNVTA